MFRYCPSCASEEIRFEKSRVFRCPVCGFTYYHNTAAASGCVIRSNAGLLFLIRGRDPARGKLDLPGGFTDPGEGVLEGLRRECIEELGWDPGPLAGSFGAPRRAGPGVDPAAGKAGNCELFASFPNTYPYKGVTYNTCDMFFFLDAPDLSEADLHIDTDELAGLRFIKSADVKLDDLAFDSTKRALKAYLDLIHQEN